MKTGWVGLALAGLLIGSLPAFAQGTREVHLTERGIVPVQTKLRFTTLIVLPEGERILDFVCGDKDFWVVSGTENLAYVKPAKADASTNLNLVTASGRVYSFLLTEGGPEPDLKLYVVAGEVPGRSTNGPRFVTRDEVDAARREVDAMRQEVLAARALSTQSAEAAIATFRASYPLQLAFPYRFRGHAAPFFVSAIFHDGTFTYIRARGSELPVLYDLRDGRPSLVTFQVERGVYVVPKVLERGYLALGKHRLYFAQAREE